MLARDLISGMIQPLSPDDSGSHALGWMDELKVSHLPLVDGTTFLGIVSEMILFGMEDIDNTLSHLTTTLERPEVKEYDHILDVIKAMSVYNVSVMPVLDQQDQYLGAISASDLIGRFAEMSAINDPGAIIVLEVNQNDYVLSQVAQIVESNDAKILCHFVTTDRDSTRMELTIKINRIDIQPLLQTFNRFNYLIKASYSQDETYHEELRERYQHLMRFLRT
ncbi:MAG: CBS domain-containing protein [Bacteroidales bacterium]|nr:CBS domain-containing protein [Bacteroidales bacterium]